MKSDRRSGHDRRAVEREHERREFDDLDDAGIKELQRRVREAKPHEPKPGDADYLAPEQVARLKNCRCHELEPGEVCEWCRSQSPVS